MANTFLTKTFASDSNRKTWTWSAWIKRSGLGGTQTLMTQVMLGMVMVMQDFI